jgi:hypothetical protein
MTSPLSDGLEDADTLSGIATTNMPILFGAFLVVSISDPS